MDLIAEGWESDLDTMVRAEALAARVPARRKRALEE